MTLSPRSVEAAIQAIDKLDHRKATSMADLTRQIAEAAITAYLAALAVDGLCLVPKEATREMLNAAIDVDSFKLGDISPLGFRESPQKLFQRCYAAMLAAASTGDSTRQRER